MSGARPHRHKGDAWITLVIRMTDDGRDALRAAGTAAATGQRERNQSQQLPEARMEIGATRLSGDTSRRTCMNGLRREIRRVWPKHGTRRAASSPAEHGFPGAAGRSDQPVVLVNSDEIAFDRTALIPVLSRRLNQRRELSVAQPATGQQHPNHQEPGHAEGPNG